MTPPRSKGSLVTRSMGSCPPLEASTFLSSSSGTRLPAKGPGVETPYKSFWSPTIPDLPGLSLLLVRGSKKPRVPLSPVSLW